MSLWALTATLPVGSAMVATATAWTGPASLPFAIVLGLVLMVASVVLPGLVGTLVGQEARLMEALRARAEASERARALADSEARTQERSRIAAEMHDLVGHRLSLASLHVGGLELALSKTAPTLRPDAATVRTTVGDALRELHQALGVLDPLGTNTQAGAALTGGIGTRADIEELAAQSAAGGINVTSQWTGPDLTDAPVPVRRAVHRVVREALTNVHRYATGAEVTVAVTHDADTVQVVVHNTAPPRSAVAEGAGTGRGLSALRERVEVLDGCFTAGPLPEGGFRLAAHLPLRGAGAAMTRSAAEEPAPVPDPVIAPALARRRTPGAIRSLMLAGGLAAVTALVLSGIGFAYAEPPRPSPPLPEPRIGMTLEQFHAAGGNDSLDARAAAAGREPARPSAATVCAYAFVPRPDHRPADTVPVVRHCFDAHRRLIAIDSFTVTTVHDTTPWKSP
ncbi:sensor histidine kinase [Streptomyces sp. NPDC017529]|uniref:sensor histidine kinase n=1 Tax=Streptomyces sp. NPDC017529 TaxID=3365000 RepID=UPI0037A8946E